MDYFYADDERQPIPTPTSAASVWTHHCYGTGGCDYADTGRCDY